MAKATGKGPSGIVGDPLLDIRGGIPTSARLPSIADLSSLSPEELLRELTRFNVVKPWDSYVNQVQQYVARMTDRTGDALKAEVDRVLSDEAWLSGQAREGRREYMTALQADGDEATEYMWLSEADDATCDACLDRSGDVDTYAGHEAKGLPGASVCLGGPRCRCELVAIVTR